MLKRLVVSRLINWRIERDDALGTLFFTFVLLWLGFVRRRLHTWHPTRFWFESEVEDCLVPVGAGTGLLVGCENEGCYMLLCWSLLMKAQVNLDIKSHQQAETAVRPDSTEIGPLEVDQSLGVSVDHQKMHPVSILNLLPLAMGALKNIF